MLPNTVKPVRIDITTYKPNKHKNSYKMNKKIDDKNEKHDKKNIMCPICLNRRDDINRTFKTCPICYQCENNNKKNKNEVTELFKIKNSKGVQTEKNLKEGLHLLTEVLTEFQNKKLESKSKSNVKDASVSTELKTPKLCYSKVFRYTVDGNLGSNQFTLICSSKNDFQENESINPIKNKSSSIPLMKLEELKNSLKEKPKSKDTITEVNRMFANVRKKVNGDELNRPLIRNGPRILPVVQTNIETNNDFTRKKSCKCCHTMTCMSSGDSFVRPDSLFNERCEKCMFMLCCHYKNSKMEGFICEKCRSGFLDTGDNGNG